MQDSEPGSEAQVQGWDERALTGPRPGHSPPQPSPPPRPQALSPLRPGKRRSHSRDPHPELVAASPHVSDSSGSTAEGRGRRGGAEEGRGPTRCSRRRCRRRDTASGIVRAPPRPPPPPRLPASTTARRLDANRTRLFNPIRPHLVRSRAGLTGSRFSVSLESGCTLGVVVQPGTLPKQY